MKNVFLNFALIAFVGLATISCKDTKEADTKEAQEVADATPVSIAYNVDTAASKITWKGSKPLGTHNGTIDLTSGSLMVTGEEIEAGKFTIDMNTITDLDLEGDMKASLEDHLKGTVEGKEGDFFNVNEYPTSTFQLTGITTTDGKTMVSGNLTIKDKTNNISFPAVITMNENSMTLISETFTIDRTKWGVNYGSKTVFDNLGDKFISDDVELTVSLVANKK